MTAASARCPNARKEGVGIYFSSIGRFRAGRICCRMTNKSIPLVLNDEWYHLHLLWLHDVVVVEAQHGLYVIAFLSLLRPSSSCTNLTHYPDRLT